jgi:hypothetical protein
MTMTGFGWKQNIKSPHSSERGRFNIALIHKYIWSQRFVNAYNYAPESSKVTRVAKKLDGYSYSFFGDNHIKFHNLSHSIVNCGSVINRTIDQKDYVPSIWCLWSNGKVTSYDLDTRRDKWLTEDQLQKKIGPEIDLRGLAERFAKIDWKNNPVDFSQMLKRLATSKKIRKSVRNIIRELLEEHSDK